MVVILKMSVNEAYDKFKNYHNIIKPYRDASKGECFYDCTI